MNTEVTYKSFNAANSFFSLQMSSLTLLNNVLGESLWENDLYYIQNAKAKVAIPLSDLTKIRDAFTKRITADPEFFNNFYGALEHEVNEFRNNYLDYFTRIEALQTTDELKNFIAEFHTYVQSITGPAYITDGIGLEYEAWLPFLPVSKDEFTDVVYPLVVSFSKKFEYDVARLKITNGDVDEFVKNNSWVQNSYADVDVITVNSINEQLQNLTYEQVHAIVNQGLPAVSLDDYKKILHEKGFNDLQVTIAFSLSRAIDLQDMRKEVVYRANSISHKAYTKLCGLYGFSLSDTDTVINGAFCNWIATCDATELFTKSKQALTGFVWYTNGTSYFGDDALTIIQSIEDSQKSGDTKQLTGYAACKGVASGSVVVVNTSDDYRHVTEGCILVTTMTRPEMISIMHKAAAFITDEGGITCHAAIVAREMNKPCIIGTKNATQVLKDGDRVQVDANTGIVTIL